jgi:hypothetical protein
MSLAKDSGKSKHSGRETLQTTALQATSARPVRRQATHSSSLTTRSSSKTHQATSSSSKPSVTSCTTQRIRTDNDRLVSAAAIREKARNMPKSTCRN